MNTRRPILLALTFMLAAHPLVGKPAPAPPDEHTAPQPVPGWRSLAPGEHPRLLFRKSDLPALRARVETPEGKAILAQLRTLLGNNGESLPTVFNPHVPRNIGPQGQTKLPVGAFTFTHAVGYGLLYQLTGDKKYAGMAKQSLQWMFDTTRHRTTGQQIKDAFAGEGIQSFEPKGARWAGKKLDEVVFQYGEPDRDERYTWTLPGAGLRTGVMLGWIAVAYDLNYDGWDDAFRKTVQHELLEAGHPLVDYQKFAEGGKRPLITLEDSLLGTEFKPTSNHMPARVGGATLALLALRGDPGVDSQRVENLLGKAEGRVREAFSGYNRLGYFAEGYGPSHMAANTVFTSMLRASRLAWGKEFVTPASKARWLTLRWVMLPVPDATGKPWYPNLTPSTYGGPFMEHGQGMSEGGEWAEGFGAVADEKDRAALLWMWNRAWGKQHTDYDAAIYPHRAVAAFINWPIGTAEANPSTALAHSIRCPESLQYLARNRWQDENDILFQFLINRESMHGNIRTSSHGIVTIYGLGERHEFSTGIRSKESKAPVEETQYETSPDGTTLIALRRQEAVHGIAVDYSPDSGAAAVIAFANPWFGDSRIRGGSGTPGINPARTKHLRHHTLDVAGTRWEVFTLQTGEHSQPVVTGNTVQIGKRLYGFDDQRVTVRTGS